MSNFSSRRGLPSSRQEEDCPRRWPGRRPGHAATCRARLEGWIRRVADRSPIWGDIDLAAFCKKTGYSREHTTRELSKIRRESSLVFETKLRTKRGSKTKRWGVIVADPEKLRFDQRSLFYDQKGRQLHNYTSLASEGEKIVPTIMMIKPSRRPRGRPRTHPHGSNPIKRRRGRPRKYQRRPTPLASLRVDGKTPEPLRIDPAQTSQTSEQKFPENTGVRDNPKGEDYSVIQQKKLYGAARLVALRRRSGRNPNRKPLCSSLKRKAFGLCAKLAARHWDNCKVLFSRRTAYRYALGALIAGHKAERIVSCYARGLFLCHGLAVDQAASTGTVVYFNPSSTVSKARTCLAADGLCRAERLKRWYEENPQEQSVPIAYQPDEMELDFIRLQIAATFPNPHLTSPSDCKRGRCSSPPNHGSRSQARA